MTCFLRALAVAIVTAAASLLTACGDDGVAAREHEHGPAPATIEAHEAHEHEPATAEAHAAHDHAPALPAGELAGTSLFHLGSAWTDHRGEPFTLPALRGRLSVFVMFYGDCTTACPLLVKAAEEIEAALPVEARGQVEFVMVTFATEADTPGRLREYARSKGLDREPWRWLVGTPLQTRQLATLLGVQYRDLGNGAFAHSNVVTVLDGGGVPIARLEGLGVALDPAVEVILSHL